MSNRTNQRSGSLLVCVLVCMGIATSIMLVAVKSSLQARRQMTEERKIEQARWLLDAGIRHAADAARADPTYAGEMIHISPVIDIASKATVAISVQPPEQDGTFLMRVTASLRDGASSRSINRSQSIRVMIQPTKINSRESNP